jgi:hypothetical protein
LSGTKSKINGGNKISVVLEATPLATKETSAQTIGGTDMTAAWASLRSMVGFNRDNLVSCKSGFVGNHKLKLPKGPSVKLRSLVNTFPLAAVSNAPKVFQHNKGIEREAINEATADGVQVGLCPTALLVAQPFPSPFGSRAFALQGAPSGTKPLPSLNQFYTRNLNASGGDKQVNFAEVNTDNILGWVARLRVRNRNGDMQVEFTIPVAFQDGEGRFTGFQKWQISLTDFERALNPFAVASSDANPKFVPLPEQSEKPCVQFQRCGFKGQKFQGLLISFENFVGFSNTVTGTDSKVSVQPEALPNVSVGQMVQGNGIEATPFKRNLTNSVAGFGKDIKGVVQPLLILWRQVKFGDNGQIHRHHHLNYSIYAKTCKGGEWRHSSVALRRQSPAAIFYET